MPSAWVSMKVPQTVDYLPEMACCYVLNLDGNLYIGSTTNLRTRIRAYVIRYSYGVDIITAFGCSKSVTLKVRPSRKYGDWAMTELRLIKRLKPSLNRTGSSRGRGWDPHSARACPLKTIIVRGFECSVFASVQDLLAGVEVYPKYRFREVQ